MPPGTEATDPTTAAPDSPDETTPSTEPTVDLPPLDESAPPPVAVLDVDPIVASPGDVVVLGGLADGTTTAQLRGPAGAVDVPLDGANLVVPDGTVPGSYTVHTAGGEFVTVGQLTVADGPAVIVRPDRTTVDPNGVVALDVSVSGVAPDAGLIVASGGMADLFGGTGTGDEEAGEDGALLVPSGSGVLLPWQFSPLEPLGAATTRVLLPAALIEGGPLRVLVGDPFGGIVPVVSDELRLRVCDSGGRVTGKVGRAAQVRVLSFSTGTLRTAWVDTPDGSFEAEVPAGPAVVIASDAESVDEPVVVDVPCGGVTDLAGSGAASGIAGSSRAAPTARQAAGGGEPCRTALVLEMPRDDTGQFSGMSGLLATRLLDAAPRLSVVTAMDLLNLVQLDAMQNLLGAEENAVMLETIGARMDADFLVHGGVYDLDGTWGAAMTALARTETDVDVRVTAGDADLFGVMDTAAEQMAFELPDAALCAELDPPEATLVPEDEQDFTLEVTNLAGAAADGATVTISGATVGRIDPREGVVEGTTFEFTYTAEENGVDTLDIEGEWRGGRAPGTVRLAADGTVTVGGGHVLSANGGFDPDASDDALGAFAISLLPTFTADAQACGEPPSGPWTGTLGVDGSGLLAALGPAALGSELIGDFGLDAPDVGDLSPGDLQGTFDVAWEAPAEGGEATVDGGFPGLQVMYVPPSTIVFLTDAGPFMDAEIEVVEPGQPPCT